MPTGTGKAVVIAGIVEQAMKRWPNLRVQVLAHVQELVEQNQEKMLRMWPVCPAGIYCAGLKRRDVAPVTFASIGSVYQRAEEFGHTNLLLIDEAHMVGGKSTGMYRRYIEDLKRINPNLRVVGLSATIFRMGMGMLTEGDLFTDVCYDITGYEAFNALIDQGFLAPLIARPTDTTFDLSNVSVSNTGEFNATELQAVMDDSEQTRRALNEVEMFGTDRRRWLIFAAGVDHAIHVDTMLRSRGYDTAVLHDKTHPNDRRRIIDEYRRGKLRCVVNNSILTTGFDVPEVDLIACLRPTKSAGLWVQMLGRGTRPCDGKDNCLVLDFGDNTPRLGPINDPVVPRKRGKGKSGGGGSPVIVLCDACGAYNHILRKECMLCNAPLPERPLNLDLTRHAGTMDVLRRTPKTDEEPQVEIFDVTGVTYTRHQKEGRPASLMVEYACGMRFFKEFVPVEWTGNNAHGLAVKWWNARMRAIHGNVEPLPAIPASVDDLVSKAHFLPVPKRISVWYNRKPYPEVLKHEFE